MNHALMFPGLGADYPAMVETFCAQHPDLAMPIVSTINRGLTEAESAGGLNHANALANLKNQLSIHALNLAWYELKRASLQPAFACGHSLGFYAAAVAAGAIAAQDALTILVHAFCMTWKHFFSQGDLGAQRRVAVITGFHALDHQAMQKQHIEILSINNPTQLLVCADQNKLDTFLSTHADAVMRIDYFPLALPFHSRAMLDVCLRLQRRFIDIPFYDPRFPLISHVVSDIFPATEKGQTALISSAEQVRWHMLHQLCLPINWPQVIDVLKTQNVGQLIEVGPNRILSQMVRWIDKKMAVQTLDCYRTVNPPRAAASNEITDFSGAQPA